MLGTTVAVGSTSVYENVRMLDGQAGSVSVVTDVATGAPGMLE